MLSKVVERIMLTNETVRQLQGLSQVKDVTEKRVIITSKYRLELFEEWKAAPGIRAVKKRMKTDGFPVTELKELIQDLVSSFKRYGKPQIGKESTDERDQRVGRGVAANILLATGKFEKAGRGIRFSPAFEEALWKAYPDQTIEEGLIAEGIDPMTVGYSRIHALKVKFKKRCTDSAEEASDGEKNRNSEKPQVVQVSTGTAENSDGGESPQSIQDDKGKDTVADDSGASEKKENDAEQREDDRNFGSRRRSDFYSKEERKAYNRNPYVESCTKYRLNLTPAFYNAAQRFIHLGIDKTLEIFDLHPERMSEGGKAHIKRTIVTWKTTKHRIKPEDEEDIRIEMRQVRALENLLAAEMDALRKRLAEVTGVKKKEQFLFVKSLNKVVMQHGGTVARLLEELEIPRTTFYNVLRASQYGMSEATREERDAKDAEVIRQVMEYKGYRKGARMIYMQMDRITGKHMALKKIRRLMRKFDMHSGVRGPNPHRQAAHDKLKENVKPNLVKRRFRLFRPGEAVLTDVTYMKPDNEKTYYASAAMDASTGRLVSFQCSDCNDNELALASASDTVNDPAIRSNVIYHSDQGATYLSDTFQEAASKLGLVQSMSKRGNCLDNGLQESFHGHFKDEVEYAHITCVEEMQDALSRYKQYYNEERPQWNRKKMTPVEFETYLNSMSEQEYAEYQKAEESKYRAMKEKAAIKAREHAKTLGV